MRTVALNGRVKRYRQSGKERDREGEIRVKGKGGKRIGRKRERKIQIDKKHHQRRVKNNKVIEEKERLLQGERVKNRQTDIEREEREETKRPRETNRERSEEKETKKQRKKERNEKGK